MAVGPFQLDIADIFLSVVEFHHHPGMQLVGRADAARHGISLEAQTPGDIQERRRPVVTGAVVLREHLPGRP